MSFGFGEKASTGLFGSSAKAQDHQLSVSESPIKIGAAVPEITRTTRPTDKNSPVFGSGNANSQSPSFNFTKMDDLQSSKVDGGKDAPEPEPASKGTCSECDRYCNKKSKDTRNEHFSELLQNELQYIQPCMRTTVYAKILNYLHATKRSHFNNDGDVVEVEKTAEKSVEETS